jgi:hypothetical protein
MLPVMAKANNEDEAEGYGKQDDGVLNLREVPNRGVSARNGWHLSLLLRTQHLKELTEGTDVEEMIADGH